MKESLEIHQLVVHLAHTPLLEVGSVVEAVQLERLIRCERVGSTGSGLPGLMINV